MAFFPSLSDECHPGDSPNRRCSAAVLPLASCFLHLAPCILAEAYTRVFCLQMSRVGYGLWIVAIMLLLTLRQN
jgi:hypothetical protein